jgi:hypothetical protein
MTDHSTLETVIANLQHNVRLLENKFPGVDVSLACSDVRTAIGRLSEIYTNTKRDAPQERKNAR